MADETGDKTERATGKHLQKAYDRGQIARSEEVQTVCVLIAALMAMTFSGRDTWHLVGFSFVSILGHLHDTPINLDALQQYGITSVIVFVKCVWPIVTAAMLGGVLAGVIQTRFRLSPEALDFNWGALNPVDGFKRTFSMRAAVPSLIAVFKLSLVVALSFGAIKEVMSDPIFHSSVDMERIARFMAESSLKIITQVALALVVIAAADYSYQLWRYQKDMMMSKEDVKEENKSAEGNPQVKAKMRRRRMALSKRKMLMEVPKADVVVTNPTHLAVALRYDRKTMKAPRIVAKGSRLNALRIRELAKEHQVPIVENKPLARLMFKYGKVGGEVPAELYAAVAEILAWVYRVNAYRYYREQSM